jgi:hypothetical protein
MNPKLYTAVLKAAIELIKQGKAPSRLLFANTHLFRAADMKYFEMRNGFITPKCATNAISVFDYGADRNRFSGYSPLHNYDNGGCYFFTNQGSGLGEMMHYAEMEAVIPWSVETHRVSIPHLLAKKCIFKVKLMKTLKVADISLYGPNAANARVFLQEVGKAEIWESGKATSVEKQFRVRLDEEAISQHGDYSVTRALGHAFCKFPDYFSGVIAQTARQTERAGESGENVCLFGPEKGKIEGLYVEGAHLFYDPGVIELSLLRKSPSL